MLMICALIYLAMIKFILSYVIYIVHFKRFAVHASLYVFNVVLRGKQDIFTLYLNRKDIIF